jgi:putative heme-binding domain-containing protein
MVAQRNRRSFVLARLLLVHNLTRTEMKFSFQILLRRIHLRLFFILCVYAAVFGAKAASVFDDFVRVTEALTPQQELTNFHLPPGFEMQLVASEPEIGKPMNMAFDAKGRLWMTQSREYPYAAPLDKPGRDKIMVLSDFDERGRARKVTTFAEGLNIPIGLLPYKNGVIAFSIPNIYYFQDTNSDGKADTKELVLGRFGFEKDVHGLTSNFRRGYDGWIYADHGYNNETTLTAKDGSVVKMQSGNCYRFRPDGSRVEQHSYGQVNPFGLMFDPLGDLWSADCHSSPVYQLLRGAYYPSFGKPNDGLGFAPNICKHSHGSTAISGMVYYDDDRWPAEYRGNTFVGNVVTCRINRDYLDEHGSTRVAREAPDFLICDDPWFRPVDLELGPDGAMYVADFYNRIIAHYEVPLDHPGRDRERGRIWRIVYRGTNGVSAAAVGSRFDLAHASAKELIRELASPNITRRMFAMNELVDRVGEAAIRPAKKMMADRKSTSTQRMHGLWVLHRLNGLDEKILVNAAQDKDRGVRVHAMRVLSETENWSQTQRALVLAGLHDTDPYVQRAAADAFGQHPDFAQIKTLLKAREAVPADDGQLLHTVRMALRNHLAPNGNLAKLQVLPARGNAFAPPTNRLGGTLASSGDLDEKDSRAIADVALGVKSAEAGRFLLKHIENYSEPREKLTTYLQHGARYAPGSEIGELAGFIQKHFAEDVDFQLAMFKSVQEGAGQKGNELAPGVRDWALELDERLFAATDSKSLEWRSFPIKGHDSPDPWIVEKRRSADRNKDFEFICSLTPGGEKYTGELRSKSFTIPEKLSFFMAGHDGKPAKPPQGKNFIRLVDGDTHETLIRTGPPRNDVAQTFSWDLSKWAGKQGIIEVVDGDGGDAYAWLAVGRFEPSVVTVPKTSPSQVDKWQQSAAEIAGSLHFEKYESKLAELLGDENADADARAAAAKALSELSGPKHLDEFRKVASGADESSKLRGKVAAVLGQINSPEAKATIVEALRTAPTSLQTELALALASNREGAEALLEAVSEGKASARLLQQRKVRDHLTAAKPDNLNERLEKLTANLPTATEERDKLIAQRKAAFNPAKASAAKGADVFKQYCVVCHTLDGQGALIGPQLDGIGGRGVDRLLEDILDPNRNVDRAFRSTLLIMNDGDVQSGLYRRDEGEMVIIAQSNGKEMSVPRKDIKERRTSETSLMPDNFGEAIPNGDFNDLIAFLLSKNVKPPTASVK